MRRYVRVTLLGGIAAILPLALVIIVFRWIIGLIERYLSPIVHLFDTESQLLLFAIYVILLTAFLVSFFPMEASALPGCGPWGIPSGCRVIEPYSIPLRLMNSSLA